MVTTTTAERTGRVPLLRRAHTWLVAVAALHAASPLLLMGWHLPLGIDETVYLSQINRYVPAGGFSAPRARGATLLGAPVTLLTDSLPVLRVWIALLSGLALYLAFRPWLRLRDGATVPIAAAMFSSIWVTAYYGFELLPNEWVGFTVVAALGLLLRFLDDGRLRHLGWAALAVAFCGLLRPSDAGFATAGLLVVALLARVPWRARLLGAAAVVIGLIAGVAEWIIEAEVSFGGVSARIHTATAEQGGSGPFFSLPAQARVLAGPILCRGSCRSHAAPVFVIWWFVAVVLIVIGLVAGRRMVNPLADRAAVIVGAFSAAQYIFGVAYGAPRFLLPTYAVVSLPCATGAVALVRSVRARVTGQRAAPARWAAVGVLGVLFAAHLAVQGDVVERHIAPPTERFGRELAQTVSALRAAGAHTDCLVLGHTGDNQPVAYALRCGNRTRPRPLIIAALRSGRQIIWFRTTEPNPVYGVQWTRAAVDYLGPGAWVSGAPRG